MSGTLIPDFAERRLRLELSAPFADYRFEHPDTRWYNLSSMLGASKHFRKNKPQILDFFTEMVHLRMSEGKRPLLVTKKEFAAECAKYLTQRLGELGAESLEVVHMPDHDQREDPRVISLIHYGVIGINDFEGCDAVYCLNSYYVETSTVDGVLQDVITEYQHVPIKVTISGNPKRRVAGARRAQDRIYDAHAQAPAALFQQEMDTVIQTIGRVRPYTKPREIIMFQCGDIPSHPYHMEFSGLEEVRQYFGVPSRRERKTNAIRDRVREAQGRGFSQLQVKAELGVVRTTVQRHWLRDE